MKPDLNELKNVLKVYDQERWKLLNLIQNLEEMPKVKNLVGKYFKFQSGYSPSYRSYAYVHVKEYKDNRLIVDLFHEDCNSKIEFFNDRTEFVDTILNYSSLNEITKTEYETIIKRLLKKLHKRFNVK